MAFTVTTQTIAARRAKLLEIQQLVGELIQINETASRVSTQLTAQGVSTAEIANTLDGILGGGGPPYVSAATDLSACTGDTISDRIINILSTQTGGVGWEHPAS